MSTDKEYNQSILIIVVCQCCQPQFVVWPFVHYDPLTDRPYGIANGKLITKVSEATEEDVDIAVEAAQKAYDTTWGLNAPGSLRTDLLWKLAQLMERDALELAALEALDNGKSFLPLLICKKNIYI